tara:strand:- start:62 stop:454 length:393 start_codon:yes stop_codon:yes gene_type:complete
MSNLDDVLKGAFIEQEQQETKSKQIEDRIKSYDGASALLPSRQYGKPINPEKFGLTLRSIIERNDPNLAAFLGISTGYHKRKEEEELALEEMKKSMLEKTEELRMKNISQKEFRERNVLKGLRPDGGRFY